MPPFFLHASIILTLSGIISQAGAQSLNPVRITSESGQTMEVEEGYLWVPESHQKLDDRSIRLTFQLAKSTHPQPGPAFFMLAGGPGGSWLETLSLDERFAEVQFYRSMGDVVIYDQRGAGRSVPNLACTGQTKIPRSTPLEEEQLAAAIRAAALACRDHWLEQGIDLAAYTTDASADDLDALRQALGYEQIVLVGGSYGSHLGLHYLKKYASHVARALFYGIEGPDHTLDRPAEVWATLERIAAAYEQDPYWAAQIGPEGLLAGYKRQLLQATEGRLPVSPLVLQFLLTYQADNRTRSTPWPQTLLDIRDGKWAFARKVATHLRKIHAPHAMGNMMDFSSWCALSRWRDIQADTTSRWLGNINLSYTAKKDVWPVQDLGRSFRKPVQSSKPVLLIHGSWDLQTPIDNAREVIHHLPNGHLLEVIHGSHDALYDLYAEWDDAQEVIGAFLKGDSLAIPRQYTLPLPFPPLYDPIQIQLWEASKKGNVGQAREALAAGADIHALDCRTQQSGRRALNWAAWYNHPRMLAFLLEAGADIHQANSSGYTPLHHAVENCSRASIRFLLGHGARPDPALDGTTLPETARRSCPSSLKWINP